MNEAYEGLSLPELFDLMHGLQLPEPVSLMPQTRGWGTVLVVLGAVLALSGLRFLRWRRRNRYRREALDSLSRLEERLQDDAPGGAAAVAALVKQTALTAWPRSSVAPLYGEAWARFLVATAGDDPVVARGAPLLARAAYEPGLCAAQLIEPARRWIRCHRV